MIVDPFKEIAESVAELYQSNPERRKHVRRWAEGMQGVVEQNSDDVAEMIRSLCIWLREAHTSQDAWSDLAESPWIAAEREYIPRFQALNNELRAVLDAMVRLERATVDEANLIKSTFDMINARLDPDAGECQPASPDNEPVGMTRILQDWCTHLMFAAGYGGKHKHSMRLASKLVSNAVAVYGFSVNPDSMQSNATFLRPKNIKDPDPTLVDLLINSRFTIVPPIAPPMDQEREPDL